MKTSTYRFIAALGCLLLQVVDSLSANAQQGPPVSLPATITAIQAITPQGELPGRSIPYYLRGGEGERYLVGGFVACLMARGIDTDNLYEWMVLTGGKGALLPSHTHSQTHEVIFVLDGEIDLWLSGQHYRMIKGDFASIPPGTTHAFRMQSHHTQLMSMNSGHQMTALYKTLGKPYAGYVQPSDNISALDPAALKQAEKAADIHFDGKPLPEGNAQRVVNAQLPKSVVPYVLAAGEGDHYTIADQLFGILCDNATTNGKLLVVTCEGPAGPMIGKHFHMKHSETFFCLDGQLRMVSNQVVLDVYPGDIVTLPAGTIHAYQHLKPYTHHVGLLTPSIFELFFRSQAPSTQHVYPQQPTGGLNASRFAELDIVPLERPGPPPSPRH